jgi:hypothetical protein
MFSSENLESSLALRSGRCALWAAAYQTDVALDDIQSDANDGVKEAQKALKLLNDNRFKK